MGPAPERVAAFLEDEADLLDRRRWREWLALFAPEAWYWVPVNAEQATPRDGPSHLYEMRPLMEARVERLYAARLIPQSPPSRTVRLLSRVRAAPEEGLAHRAQARFVMVESRVLHEADDETEQRLLAGEITWGLVEREGALSILWKRVDLLNSEGGLRGLTVPL